MDLITSRGLARPTTDLTLPADRPFTAAEARDLGVTRKLLDVLVKTGVLRRPVKRVYVAADLVESLEQRIGCLRLVVPPDCVVVDRHAGWLHGAEMVLAPNEHLELQPITMYRLAGKNRLRNSLADSGERTVAPHELMEIGGLVVTTPIRTAWDLGRVRHPDRAIAGLDAMLRLKKFDKDEMVAGVEQFRGQRWVRTLRAIAPLADGRAESPPESVLRLRCIECNLPGMVPQVEVFAGGRFVARLDLADVALMAAVEYDGEEWHSSPEQSEHDRGRRAEARDAGWLVEPFTKVNLFGFGRDVEDKLFALDREARRRIGRSIA